MTTLPFGPKRDSDPLVEAASALPKDVAPPRDLWPAIAARLDAQSAPVRGVRWPMALAAGFVVAAVSALLTWGLMREPAAPPEETRIANPETAQPAVVPVRYGPNTPLGEAQLAARDELLVRFRERLATLPPAQRESVVKNLAVIQRAADEIDAALAQDPASGLLNELLMSTYRKELQLYSQVVTARDGTTRSS